MLCFGIGLIIGGFVGIFWSALCQAASNRDIDRERNIDKDK